MIALRNQAGQALDLRHRLPLAVGAGAGPAGRAVGGAEGRDDDPCADQEQVALVDAAVAAAVDESPGRMLGIAEAKTIEADLEGYRARLAEDERRTGVWLSPATAR